MSWEFIKYRIRKRAEGAAVSLASYIHGENEENPEENLENYLRRQARLREFEEGLL